jgi:beta-carotene 15,15'-dioxygenase
MNNTTTNFRFIAVAAITVFFGILGFYLPDFLLKIQYFLLGGLTLVIGLPHGATDFLLFQHLQGLKISKKQVIMFFSGYLLAVFAYFLSWVVFPLPSLLLFLAISMYHFGQSNWQDLRFSKGLSYLLFLSWGAFVLGGSVLWHWEESKIVIGQLIGFVPNYSAELMVSIQWFLLLLNVILIVLLFLTKKINKYHVVIEFSKLGLLSFLLYFSPLVVGFTIYFTLWHSLESLVNQMDFFRRQIPKFSISDYYRQSAPYTLLAVLGLMGLVLGQSLFFAESSLISLFLVLIACVTLPHIFLIEESLK